MLNLELRAGAMPRVLAVRKVTAPERRRRAIRTVQRIWAAPVRAERRTELLDAIDAVLADRSYMSYTTARFVVSKWRTTTIASTDATVALVGYETYHAPGEQWTSGKLGLPDPAQHDRLYPLTRREPGVRRHHRECRRHRRISKQRR
jgi:hypothetical protein